MKANGFNHIGINIKRLDKSLWFYRDVLGAKEQNTVKMPDCTIVYLTLENGGRIELFYHGEKNERIARDDTRVGYRHIAIDVDDVDAWADHLRENGVSIVLEPVDIPELGVRVVLFEDPDGTVLEFCRPL